MTNATMTATQEKPFYIDLDGQLDQGARHLDAALRSRYEPGFERTLAGELIAGLTPAQRTKALHTLAYSHVSSSIHTVTCLLDETDSGTYAATQAMTDMLLKEIAAQDREAAALQVLVTEEICTRQKLLRVERHGDEL